MKFSSPLLLTSFLALTVSVVPVQAQQARSFVSNEIGNDANAPNCLRLAPCRTFQVAHDNTLANGEVTVLDPGSYGAVHISKNISIINDGVGEAGALVSGGSAGITINAGASDSVTLRGLTIKGIGFGGGTGIVFNSGSFLSIENCVVRNLTGGGGIVGSGIVFQPTVSGNAASLQVLNTVVTDNQFDGIWIKPIGHGFIHAVLQGVTSSHNGRSGIVGDDSALNSPAAIEIVVESSVAGQNGSTGFDLAAPGGLGPAFMLVTRSVAEGNGIGLRAGTSGVVNVGQSSVAGNAVTWSGLVQSFGDNYVAENFDGDPAAPLGAIVKK